MDKGKPFIRSLLACKTKNRSLVEYTIPSSSKIVSLNTSITVIHSSTVISLTSLTTCEYVPDNTNTAKKNYFTVIINVNNYNISSQNKEGILPVATLM